MGQVITVPTYTATIYVGLRKAYGRRVLGLDEVRHEAQCYAEELDMCVSVTPTEFFYRGNHEPGAAVGFINYPRRPLSDRWIRNHALALGRRLRAVCQQKRVSVVFPDETVMLGDI